MPKPSAITELLALGRNSQMIAAALFKWQKQNDQHLADAIERSAAADSEQARRLAAIERHMGILVLGLAEMVDSIEASILVSDQYSTQANELLREVLGLLRGEHPRPLVRQTAALNAGVSD